MANFREFLEKNTIFNEHPVSQYKHNLLRQGVPKMLLDLPDYCLNRYEADVHGSFRQVFRGVGCPPARADGLGDFGLYFPLTTVFVNLN